MTFKFCNKLEKHEIKRGKYKVKFKFQSFINCSSNEELACTILCECLRYASVGGAFRDASSLGGNLNQRDKSSRETIFLYHKI